jgi:hypothetical protein
MGELREFLGPDDRPWLAMVEWRGGGGGASEGAAAGDYRVLRFQTAGEVRIATYREDWDELSAERLREILAVEARPESEWQPDRPPASDDEGLHGLSDAPGG